MIILEMNKSLSLIKLYVNFSCSLIHGSISLSPYDWSKTTCCAKSLKRWTEGCALKADIINITEETRANLWSSCYRCKADFYSYSNPEFKAQNDEIYNSEDVKNRVSKDRGNNTLILVGSVVAGFLFGFFVL
jgi:hypothetical protein